MRAEVQNQITMLGNAVAAEVTRARDSHRRWLRLAPLEDQVQLLEVEVPADVDPSDWPQADEDYIVVSTATFASLDEALDAVATRGVDTDSFDAVWKSENPF